MRDMLRWGAAWIDDQLVDHVSETVVYVRDGEFQITAPATMGRSQVTTSGDGTMNVDAEMDDFIFCRDDLSTPELGRITPERDDYILRTMPGGETQKYLVLPIAGEPGYVRSDGHDYRIRIHTTRISQ